MPGSGFVDLQVNGYAGVDFSALDLNLELVSQTVQRLRQRGTLAFLPTVITSSWEIYERNLPILAQACADPLTRSHLLGIHLEGPYLSPLDGARGVHPAQFLCLPSCSEFDRLYNLAQGRIRLLTLAPELPGALDLIRHAVSLGVVVSIGHTLADSPTIQAAVQAGAALSTHLGNGCPLSLHRHANPLWSQLAHPGLTAMLITDGHHLPAEFVQVALACKGAAGLVITSDSSPAAGLPPGEYEFFGTRAVLEPTGRLHSPQTGTLAGSSAVMLDCLNWLAGCTALTETELWAVGRLNPLRVLGLDESVLPPGGVVIFEHGQFLIKEAIS
jgi:N-acetylglucosamine-6-phosphate deacetylase